MYLYVQSKGGQGQPLVLFHGWGFDSQIWDSLLDKLRQDFHIYVVDLPGFGQSEFMNWPTFKKALFQQLPQHFSVLGWSMGGTYAMQLASEHPESVKHLICVGATPRLVRSEDWPGVDPMFFDTFFADLEADPIEALKGFVKAQTGEDIDVTSKKLPQEACLKASLYLLKDSDFRAALAKVKKACFMFGRLDKIVPFSTLSVLKKQYPTFEYVLFKKAGHMPFMSDRDNFLSELRRVLIDGHEA